MSVVIQAMTISGRIIDSARWEVDGRAGFREGQAISVSVPVQNGPLISFLTKRTEPPNGCMLDGQKGDWSVILSCEIAIIRHMLNGKSKQVDSMVIVKPVNRTAEQVLLYILNPQKCDPRYVQAIRDSSTRAPA